MSLKPCVDKPVRCELLHFFTARERHVWTPILFLFRIYVLILQVATAIRGAIITAKMSLVPIRRGYWGNKIGKVHTVPTKITGEIWRDALHSNAGYVHYSSAQ